MFLLALNAYLLYQNNQNRKDYVELVEKLTETLTVLAEKLDNHDS